MATAILSEQKGGEQIILSLLFEKNNRQQKDDDEEQKDNDEEQKDDQPAYTNKKTDTPIYTTTPATEPSQEKITYYTRTQIQEACGISPKSSQISQWKTLVDNEWKTGNNFIAEPYDYNGPNGELQFTNEALKRIAANLSTKNQEKINQLLSNENN